LQLQQSSREIPERFFGVLAERDVIIDLENANGSAVLIVLYHLPACDDDPLSCPRPVN
jgi:hypothetical protein